MQIIKNNINSNIYTNFSSNSKPQEIKNIKSEQILTNKKEPKKNNFLIFLTTVAGTLLPILVIRKYQGKTLNTGVLKGLDFKSKAKEVFKSFNIEYGLKEMLFTSFGSILGGLSGGLLFKKDENKKNKIKESIFQFSNSSIPTIIVAGLLKLAEKSKNPKAILPKITAVITGIGAGMPIAAITSNKINNTIVDKDNSCKRKLRVKDCFVHLDDLIGALVLAKIPFADKLHVDKILPVLYGMCGYESGVKR